jgi:hypothetical protein
MAPDAHADRLSLSRRPTGTRLVVGLATVALVTLAVIVIVNALDDGGSNSGGELKGTSGDVFKLSYPPSWRPLSSQELADLPGRPLAVVRRKDGEGFVVLRRERRAPKSFGAFSTSLGRALEKRIPDYEKRSARVIKIRAGEAFFLSYIRKRRGTVHTVVIVPAGKRSYVLNTVSTGGSKSVVRQIARIILSFDA